MKNTITLPAKTFTAGQLLDKYFHLLSPSDQKRTLAAALRALNKAQARG
jgi:hypothetical protein